MSALTAPISATEFQNASDFVVAVLAEADPTLDLSRGSAITGLVVESEAQMAAVTTANYNALNLSFSLDAIAKNLATVSDAFVDSLISNYYITRKTATAASGPARVIVNLNVSYVIPAGFAFTANGITYTTSSLFRVFKTTAGAPVTATQTNLIPRGDGNFEFTVNVTATTTGAASSLGAGTALAIVNAMTGMVSAAAATDFTGGSNAESTADLLARAQAGVTAKTLAGPDHIEATLDAAFPGIKTAVIGIGDALMTRDRGNLFGVSMGATEDIWAKTSAYPPLRTLSGIVATAPAAGTSLSFTLTGDLSAGIYRIKFIRPTGTSGAQGWAPTSVVAVKRTDLVWSPKTLTQSDLNYGGIASLVVTFTDPTLTAPVAAGYEAPYDIDVVLMPSISDVSAYVYNPLSRPKGTDYYVRAGVPCVVSAEISITVPVGTPLPSIPAIQAAVAGAINALPFNTPRLSPYSVYTAIAPILTAGEVSSVVFNALILAPTGVDIILPNGFGLAIPTDLANMYSPENTFFTCPPANVGVTIVSK